MVVGMPQRIDAPSNAANIAAGRELSQATRLDAESGGLPSGDVSTLLTRDLEEDGEYVRSGHARKILHFYGITLISS
jgi:hypothetical protein